MMALPATLARYRQRGLGRLLRTGRRYLSVEQAMAPLFFYMRRQTTRDDDIYRLHVHPDEISRSKLFPPNALPATGEDAVFGRVGGPWDRLTVSFENHYLSRSVAAHLDGQYWETTPIYDHPKYADDPERARRRCQKIERIIDSIRTNGYQSQHDLDGGTDRPADWIGETPIADEILVGMDREGGLIHLKNGRHRLAVAQHLGVDRIPILLSLYHPGAGSVPAAFEQCSVVRDDAFESNLQTSVSASASRFASSSR